MTERVHNPTDDVTDALDAAARVLVPSVMHDQPHMMRAPRQSAAAAIAAYLRARANEAAACSLYNVAEDFVNEANSVEETARNAK